MTRGGFVHNTVLLDSIAKTLAMLGAALQFEYQVPLGGAAVGFIDLFAVLHGFRIAIEAECSPLRVANDVAKAKAADVDLLLIVTPTADLSRKAKRALYPILNGQDQDDLPEIWILPIGVAIKRITYRCQLKTISIVTKSISHKSRQTRGKETKS